MRAAVRVMNVKRLLRLGGPPPSAPSPARHHVIPFSSLALGETIGAGEFGAVRRGVWRSGGRCVPVAVKCLYADRLNADAADFLEEATVMRSVRHERVVRLYGVALHESALMMVTELAPLRSLLDCLTAPDARRLFPRSSLLDFALQIADGMAHLERRRLIHRDLAARNVLVFSPHRVKISDFGLSRALGAGEDYYRTDLASASACDLRLPVAWLAPESVNFLRFTSASDVWAYGVTLWETLTYGARPWEGLSAAQIAAAVDEPERRRLEPPPDCPPTLRRLMAQCWAHEPSARPTFAELSAALGDPPRAPRARDSERAPLIDPDSPSRAPPPDDRFGFDALSINRRVRRFRWPRRRPPDVDRPDAPEPHDYQEISDEDGPAAAAPAPAPVSAVRPISAHDRRALDSAIALANKITVGSMERDAPEPGPAARRKFSLRFARRGADPGRRAGPERRNFSAEARLVPDLRAALTEESRLAYESLVERPRGPPSATDVVDAPPLPPRHPDRGRTVGRRHARRHPLLGEDPGSETGGLMERSPDRVSVEDLLEFAGQKPCGRQRGTDSDEVRIMCKVLNHRISPDACLAALEFASWNVHRAIKLAELKSLGDGPTMDQCSVALDDCEWDVAKAAARLLNSQPTD